MDMDDSSLDGNAFDDAVIKSAFKVIENQPASLANTTHSIDDLFNAGKKKYNLPPPNTPLACAIIRPQSSMDELLSSLESVVSCISMPNDPMTIVVQTLRLSSASCDILNMRQMDTTLNNLDEPLVITPPSYAMSDPDQFKSHDENGDPIVPGQNGALRFTILSQDVHNSHIHFDSTMPCVFFEKEDNLTERGKSNSKLSDFGNITATNKDGASVPFINNGKRHYHPPTGLGPSFLLPSSFLTTLRCMLNEIVQYDTPFMTIKFFHSKVEMQYVRKVHAIQTSISSDGSSTSRENVTTPESKKTFVQYHSSQDSETFDHAFSENEKIDISEHMPVKMSHEYVKSVLNDMDDKSQSRSFNKMSSEQNVIVMKTDFTFVPPFHLRSSLQWSEEDFFGKGGCNVGSMSGYIMHQTFAYNNGLVVLKREQPLEMIPGYNYTEMPSSSWKHFAMMCDMSSFIDHKQELLEVHKTPTENTGDLSKSVSLEPFGQDITDFYCEKKRFMVLMSPFSHKNSNTLVWYHKGADTNSRVLLIQSSLRDNYKTEQEQSKSSMYNNTSSSSSSRSSKKLSSYITSDRRSVNCFIQFLVKTHQGGSDIVIPDELSSSKGNPIYRERFARRNDPNFDSKEEDNEMNIDNIVFQCGSDRFVYEK